MTSLVCKGREGSAANDNVVTYAKNRKPGEPSATAAIKIRKKCETFTSIN